MTTPQHNEEVPAGAATPNGDQTKSLGVGHNVEPSISQDTDVPLLHTMNARGQRVATAYYESGVLAGIQIGRRQVEDEDAARWAELARHIRSLAKVPEYADLCQRRNEPERAQRQRGLLRQKGLVA